METTDNDNICWRAAYSLREIAKGNQGAISEMMRILGSTEKSYICWQAAMTLETLVGKEEAIAAIIAALKTGDRHNRYLLAMALEKITGKEEAIAVLSKVLETSNNDRWLFATALRQIAGEERAISELIGVIERTKNERSRKLLAGWLGKLAEDDSKRAIATLVRLLNVIHHQKLRQQVAEKLRQKASNACHWVL